MIGRQANAEAPPDFAARNCLLQGMFEVTDPFVPWTGGYTTRINMRPELSVSAIPLAASGSSSPVYYVLTQPGHYEASISLFGPENSSGNAFLVSEKPNSTAVDFDLDVLLRYRTTSEAGRTRFFWECKVEPSRPSSGLRSRNTNPLTFRSYFSCRGTDAAIRRESRGSSSNWTFVAADKGPDASRPEAARVDHIIDARVDDFLEEVYRLESSKNLYAATDLVYDQIEQLLYEGSFGVCDQILERVEVDRLSTALMRSFLAITAPARCELIARNGLAARIRKAMIGRLGEEKTNRLLSRIV